MIACAAAVPRVDLPESGVEPTAKRATPEPRTDGQSDGPAPRPIRFEFRVGKEELSVEGWCREQVWTTLQRRAAIPFVLRESWSRLGTRSAERIARSRDAVFQGVLARVRPTADGHLDFVVEISSAHVGPASFTFEWEGSTIRIPEPFQQGYRFAGRVPAGFKGPIAAWGELSVAIVDSAEATASAPAMHDFAFGATAGSVTDTPGARAEFYRVRFAAREPIERDHDGILQALFRIQRERLAAGTQRDDTNEWLVYGDESLSNSDG